MVSARVSPAMRIAYSAALFVCDGACMLVFALARRRMSIVVDARGYWKIGLLGGALSVDGLLDCDLGHDGRADRHCRRVAGDQRSVRRH